MNLAYHGRLGGKQWAGGGGGSVLPVGSLSLSWSTSQRPEDGVGELKGCGGMMLPYINQLQNRYNNHQIHSAVLFLKVKQNVYSKYGFSEALS